MRKGVMFLYGIGFRDLVLLKSTKGKEYCIHNIDETIIQMVGNITICG
jgi:hypothetical protein